MLIDCLNLLVCPECEGNLDLKISRETAEGIDLGVLRCLECDRTYQIKDDIAYFSGQVEHAGVRNQQATYSLWWDRYHNEQSITNPANVNELYDSLRIKPEEFRNKLVLDAGCGNGRFSYVVSRYNPSLLVCFDISSGLTHCREALRNGNSRVRASYVQGDITKLPFRKEIFDVILSWGVLHHTPNTEQTFNSVSTRVRPGGQFGIYVYEFRPLHNYGKQWLSLAALGRSLFLIRPLRFFCSRMPAWVAHLIFWPIYWIERILNIGVMGCHGPADDKWNRERYFRVVIDRFKTRYASEHQMEEVFSWFRRNGYNGLRVGWWPKISVSGIKMETIEDRDSFDIHIFDKAGRIEPAVTDSVI